MTHVQLDLDRELTGIDADYQETFRRVIEAEIAAAPDIEDEQDRLAYLRRRQDTFRSGDFVHRSGRTGHITIDPDQKYERRLAGKNGAAIDPAARRTTLLKVAVFVGVFLIFAAFMARNRGQDTAGAAGGTPPPAAEGGATPTPALPAVAGADALQTIGGLGGALTLGRPGALELTYSSREETVALPIDPSQTTPRGELRYNAATMRSENPVAVWLFGTVLNYAIGVPEGMVRGLQPGDRVTLSTDTGASLSFLVTEKRTATSHQAGSLLSQNRVGLTLFALPAAAEDAVLVALASYDITSEERQTATPHALGDAFPLAAATVTVESAEYAHTATGGLQITVRGGADGVGEGKSLMLSLTASDGQTTSVPLLPAENGEWQATFTLPDAGARPLFAELRALPAGTLAVVALGEVPALIDQLDVVVSGASWDPAAGTAVVPISLHNPGPGAVYLTADYISFPLEAESVSSQGGGPIEGGDADGEFGQVTPSLPRLVAPGETVGLTVTFLPDRGPDGAFRPVTVQVGADLWEISSRGMAETPQTAQP